LAPDVPKAGLIVGKLAHELHERERRFRGKCADRVTAVNGGHLSLLVGKNARRGATWRAFALSKPNIRGRVGCCDPDSLPQRDSSLLDRRTCVRIEHTFL